MIRSHLLLTLGLLAMIFSAPLSVSSSPDSLGNRVVTDFSTSSPDLGWYVVNDNVMGGRSQGDFAIEDTQLRFSGRTNTNGGGFSSIRSRALQLDLSGFDGIQLRVFGDGRRYTWRLTTDATYRGRTIAYWADFATEKGKWQTVEIPFSEFTPRIRGMLLDGPALDRTRVCGMGLMIYDKQDGAFTLRLDEIHALSLDDAGGKDR